MTTPPPNNGQPINSNLQIASCLDPHLSADLVSSCSCIANFDTLHHLPEFPEWNITTTTAGIDATSFIESSTTSFYPHKVTEVIKENATTLFTAGPTVPAYALLGKNNTILIMLLCFLLLAVLAISGVCAWYFHNEIKKKKLLVLPADTCPGIHRSAKAIVIIPSCRDSSAVENGKENSAYLHDTLGDFELTPESGNNGVAQQDDNQLPNHVSMPVQEKKKILKLENGDVTCDDGNSKKKRKKNKSKELPKLKLAGSTNPPPHPDSTSLET